MIHNIKFDNVQPTNLPRSTQHHHIYHKDLVNIYVNNHFTLHRARVISGEITSQRHDKYIGRHSNTRQPTTLSHAPANDL